MKLVYLQDVTVMPLARVLEEPAYLLIYQLAGS